MCPTQPDKEKEEREDRKASQSNTREPTPMNTLQYRWKLVNIPQACKTSQKDSHAGSLAGLHFKEVWFSVYHRYAYKSTLKRTQIDLKFQKPSDWEEAGFTGPEQSAEWAKALH